MSKGELAELKALQGENRKLKRIVANQAPDIEAYKKMQRGNGDWLKSGRSKIILAGKEEQAPAMQVPESLVVGRQQNRRD